MMGCWVILVLVGLILLWMLVVVLGEVVVAVVVVVVVLHEDILRLSSWRMEALKWIQMTSFVSVNLTTQKMIY